MTEKTGGQALVTALLDHGATHGFCVPGESYLPVLDALYDVQERFSLIICRHEAAAATMAEATGKLTGAPGIAFVTRGPGATHAAIGVHTAQQDSTPMILFIGDVASDQRDREAFQEVDFAAMFAPLAKWAARIDRTDRIGEYVARAFKTAVQGRPGPVVLALPEDVLSGQARVPRPQPTAAAQAAPDPAAMAALADLLDQARQPLLVLGGAGWSRQAVETLQAWAERYAVPVATSFRCQDLIDNDSPVYAGDLGIGANPALVAGLSDADVILALGPRLGEMTTGGYTRLRVPQPDQALVHVHPGAEELGRVYHGVRHINAALPLFVDALAALAPAGDRRAWTQGLNAAYTRFNQPIDSAGAFKPAFAWAHLRDVLPADAIIANGAGNYAGWLHRFFRFHRFKTQLAPTSGAMGYGVPAAIAAKILYPERDVICAAGDGCFQMAAAELATAVQYKANIVILLFDNSQYGTIRMHQEKHYPGRVCGTQISNPDFAALARAHGCLGLTADSNADFQAAVAEARAADRPALVHIRMNPSVLSPTVTLSGS